MHVTEILFVLSAGALTLLSPCGYPLFLAYLSYYIGSGIPFRKVLGGGSVATVGFLTVFVAIGMASAVLGQMALLYIPVLTLVAGIVVMVIGAVTLLGEKLAIGMPSIKATTRSGLAGLYIFGLAFGMAAAACSAPIFLAIILVAMTSGRFLDAILTFLVYALGMGVPVITSGLLVATARDTVLKRLVRMRPWLDRISGALMILIGFYLIYYFGSTYLW